MISGLLLTGSLYLVHAGAIPRSIVLLTLGLVMVSLCLRRMIYRAICIGHSSEALGPEMS